MIYMHINKKQKWLIVVLACLTILYFVLLFVYYTNPFFLYTDKQLILSSIDDYFESYDALRYNCAGVSANSPSGMYANFRTVPQMDELFNRPRGLASYQEFCYEYRFENSFDVAFEEHGRYIVTHVYNEVFFLDIGKMTRYIRDEWEALDQLCENEAFLSWDPPVWSREFSLAGLMSLRGVSPLGDILEDPNAILMIRANVPSKIAELKQRNLPDDIRAIDSLNRMLEVLCIS